MQKAKKSLLSRLDKIDMLDTLKASEKLWINDDFEVVFDFRFSLVIPAS